MKKITLLVASILLMGGGVANAAENSKFPQERRVAVDFRHADPIVFTEGGIEFYIFADGQFDFNARTYGRDKAFKANKRGNGHRNYGAASTYRENGHGVKVQYDRRGNVTRVGNVSIYFDSNDRVRRVGAVQMTYNRFALERVGGLEIIYNRRGQIVDMVGRVNDRRGYVYNQQNDYDDRDYRAYDSRVVKQDNRVAASVDVRIVKRN